MGDISAEPSMEDILSSIKRIIAEEGDGATGQRAKRPSRPAPLPRADRDAFGHEEILELSDPVEPPPMPRADPMPPPTATAPRAATVATAVAVDPIVSPSAAEATRGPLDALSRLVVKPETAGSDTLEGLVREMLRPMLRDWLDANLPQMVENMVAREIARITEQR